MISRFYVYMGMGGVLSEMLVRVIELLQQRAYDEVVL